MNLERSEFYRQNAITCEELSKNICTNEGKVIHELSGHVQELSNAYAALTAKLAVATEWVYCDDRLPERKEGWNHTDEVLVWYEGGEQKIAKYGIAYYHYDPPHRAPEWVDFANLGRVPWMWKAIVRPEKGGDVDARTG